MKKDYTHITIILDRTGSMESIRDDAIGGFNSFLKQQQEVEGDATLSVVQFDSQDPFEIIHDFKEISRVPELTNQTYVPRAMTPLLDAMGRGIVDLEQKLTAMPTEKQPAKVIMVVITDGHENASLEFRKEQIVQMIQDKEKKLDWQFVFLGSDLAGISDAMASGFQHGKSMRFNKTSAGTTAAFCSVSERVSDFRSGRAKDVSFSDVDRAKQDDTKSPDDSGSDAAGDDAGPNDPR